MIDIWYAIFALHSKGIIAVRNSRICKGSIKYYNTVDSRYLEIEGTLRNSSRYPYFDISDL